MAAVRVAHATWKGNLGRGEGYVTAGSSELFKELPISWPARTEEPDGQTSPEELLAAAHASCYAMALSNTLVERGSGPPDVLGVTARATFDKVGEGWRVTTIDLDVVGSVPDLDEDAFREAANAADEGCPISNALRGNVEIRVRAALETERIGGPPGPPSEPGIPPVP